MNVFSHLFDIIWSLVTTYIVMNIKNWNIEHNRLELKSDAHYINLIFINYLHYYLLSFKNFN